MTIGGMDRQIERLRRLPLRKECVVLGGLSNMYAWITPEGEAPYRPRIALWITPTGPAISEPNLIAPDRSGIDEAWSLLIRFLASPPCGFLPGLVVVSDAELATLLRQQLEALGVEVKLEPVIPPMRELLRDMAEKLDGYPVIPGTLAAGGITLEQLRSFAAGAAAFYEAAPWRELSDRDLISVTSPKAPAGLKHLSVLGAGGQVYGMGFYARPSDMWDIQRAPDPETHMTARRGIVWQMAFGPMMELPFDDLDLWAAHALPLAGPRAYPCLVGYRGGREVVRPSAKQLEYVEGLLRALAATTPEQMDSGQWSVQVQTATAGAVEYRLSMPDLLKPPGPGEMSDRGFEFSMRAMEGAHSQAQRLIDQEGLEDPREINEALNRNLTGQRADEVRYPPRNPLEAAQDLCYQAFGSFGRRQLQLARQALAISPDCADAYVILGEFESDPARALQWYRLGVEAGERALGPKCFEEQAGNFWGILETRPYMRARHGLAQTLQEMGQEEEAVGHYRELLRLNPGDNQGVRYLYLPLLLKLGKDLEAATYMKNAPEEGSAAEAYTRALLAFRLGGDTPTARKELQGAMDINPDVPYFLITGEIPEVLPTLYSPGSIEEAVIAAEDLWEPYYATAGAIEWLMRNVPPPRNTSNSRKRGKKKR